MLDRESEPAAFKALQALAIRGRTYAYEKVSYDEIADLMDRMEYLAALTWEPDDTTQKFEVCLTETAERHGCWTALEPFE